MRWLHAMITMAVLGSGLLAADEKVRAFRFRKEDVGKLPPGWTAAKTGMGDGSVWKVVADETAPSKTGHVLAQTAVGPRPLFNLCVADDTRYKDVEVSVAFKAVRGEVDQGGGIVWRYQDPNNYYIVRYNPLESNFRVYKVVDGKRIELGSQGGLKLPAGEWYTIRVEHGGATDEIRCYLDGKLLLRVEGETTFQKAGKVGLWTKADAVTHFDNFTVTDRGK